MNFGEKVKFHTDYQEQFGVTANTRDPIQLQLDKLNPLLPTQTAQEEIMTTATSECVENTYVGGVKRINQLR